MTIDIATGLPEVPEGHYWQVVEMNYPVTGTLRVELRVDKEVTKTKTVLDELPKKWYQTNIRTEKRTVKYTAVESEVIACESLIDTHTYIVGQKDTWPVGPGWVQQFPAEHVFLVGMTRYSTQTRETPKEYTFKRKQAPTPENVLAAATTICERLEAQRKRQADETREAEARAMLIGKYPPKTLKG